MVTTADNERRKTYKRIWYKKKRANDAGDIYMVQFYEDQLDEIRKIKQNPEARKKQLAERAKRRAAIYKKKSKSGYFRIVSKRYRKRNHRKCLERNREYRKHMSSQEREKRLRYHRNYNRAHHEKITKRARLYARHNKERARKNSKRYYYNHKKQASKER